MLSVGFAHFWLVNISLPPNQLLANTYLSFLVEFVFLLSVGFGSLHQKQKVNFKKNVPGLSRLHTTGRLRVLDSMDHRQSMIDYGCLGMMDRLSTFVIINS